MIYLNRLCLNPPQCLQFQLVSLLLPFRSKIDQIQSLFASYHLSVLIVVVSHFRQWWQVGYAYVPLEETALNR
jgi:hypothetical protein